MTTANDSVHLAAPAAESLSKIKCPHCSGEISIRPTAHFKEQVIYMSLKYEGESMSATTVAGTLTNMDKLLRAVAKDVGFNAHVFLQSVEQKPHELTFGFLVCEAKKKPRRAAAALSEKQP